MDSICFCCQLMKALLVITGFEHICIEIEFRCSVNETSKLQGYRDDSLETVKKNRDDYNMPLKIMSYEELYGWSMDKIVKQVLDCCDVEIELCPKSCIDYV